MIITTTHPLTLGMRTTIASYSARLEEATNFCIELDYDHDEEEFLFYLIDPCGDRDGDPWTCFSDLVFDTESALVVES